MTKRGKWTEQEVKILKESNHLDNKELAEVLNRTPASIRYKREIEGIRKYNIDWKKELEENKHLTQSEIAELLDVSQSAVQKQAKRHGIRLNKSFFEKHLKYEEYLLNNYGVKSYREMAEELGISSQMVANYALDNRLVEVEGIYALYKGDIYIGEGNFYELSDISGIKPSTLKWHSHNLANEKKTSVFKIDD